MVKKLRSFASTIDKRIENKIQDLSKQLMKDIVYDATVNFSIKHGNTSKILDRFFIEQTDKYSWLIGNNHPKSKLLEVGSPKHRIEAINKPLLVFETPYPMKWIGVKDKNGKFVIGRDGGYLNKTLAVKHPGFKGTYYLKHSIEDNIVKFKKSLKSKL